MYKNARIKYIKSHPASQLDGLITLQLVSLDELPLGYAWEDKGTEFTYNGMLYDIINIYPSEAGFIINALADVTEISLDQKHIQLAQQQKERSSKTQQIFKWVFTPFVSIQIEDTCIFCLNSGIHYPMFSQNIVAIPQDNLRLPPEMN